MWRCRLRSLEKTRLNATSAWPATLPTRLTPSRRSYTSCVANMSKQEFSISSDRDGDGDPPWVRQIASGYRWVVGALCLQLATGLWGNIWGRSPKTGVGDFSPLEILLLIVAFVVAWVGTSRVATGLKCTPATRLLLVLSIGCASLFGLLVLFSHANRVLKEAGYRLGLFGVSRQPS